MWPPNSPNLNPVDYSMWEYCKRSSTKHALLNWTNLNVDRKRSGPSWIISSLLLPFVSGVVDSSIATHYCTGSATTCTDAYKPSKTPQHTSSPTREGASTSRPSCSSYTLASSPPTCSISDRRAGVQGTAQPLSCVPGG